MKKPWLLLAALVAFAAVAAVEAATEEHQLEPGEALRYNPCSHRYRPGCYSSISGMDIGVESSEIKIPELQIPVVEWEPKATLRTRLPDWQQPLLEVKPTEESFLSILRRLSTATLAGDFGPAGPGLGVCVPGCVELPGAEMTPDPWNRSRL